MKEGDYMATSGTNGTSGYSNTMRMTGFSGFDVDSTVAKLMKVETAKLDKVKQERQVMVWRQEMYRSVTSMLQSFQSSYLNSLSSSSNLLSSASYSAFAAKYNSLDSSNYFSVTTGSGTKAGNYTIDDIVTALSAKVSGADMSAAIKGTALSSVDISALKDNNQINVTFNGVTKLITLGTNGSIDALKTDLNNKLAAAFGAGKITVDIDTATGNQLKFDTASTNSVSFSYAYNDGYNKIFGTGLDKGFTTTTQNNKFKVTLGSQTKTFELPSGVTYNNADEMAAAVQGLLDDPANGFGPGQIRVLNQNGTLSIKAIGTDSVSIESGSSPLFSSSDASTFPFILGNAQTLNLKVGADTKSITLEAKEYKTKYEYLSAIQSKLDSAFGKNKVMVSMDSSNKLRFESISSNTGPTAAAVENGGLAALGLVNANTSNKINADAHLYDIRTSFKTDDMGAPIFTANGTDEDIKFTINNKEFKFSSKSTSLNDIIKAVNSDADANVTMSYDSLNNKVSLQTKDTGVAVTLNASDTSGGFLTALGITANGVTGRDASMTFNDGVNGPQTIIRATNNFSINGIAFTLKQDMPANGTGSEPITLSLSSDPTKAVEMIKGFVDSYNKLLDKINTLIYEQYSNKYPPLTDDQKSSMKDEDIKNWETKAKTGLLENDSILESIAYKMRNALVDTVEGSGISLYSIGISSKSYADKGKLSVNDTILKKALTENPDEVINLFTNVSKTTTYDVAADPTKASARYKDSGLAYRLNDIIQEAIHSSPDKNGQKGLLLEKAGIQNTATDYLNILSEQIRDEDDKIASLTDYLTQKENDYYARFSRIESLISQMSAQSSMFSQG